MAPRRAQRRDANDTPELRAELERMGAVVYTELEVDWLVGYRERWYTFEVKDPAKPPSRRRLTDREADFLAECRARRLPGAVILTLEDALIELGVVR